MVKKHAENKSIDDEEVTGPVQISPPVAPLPPLYMQLHDAGFAPTLDAQARNFALVANKTPLVVGKDAQLIFEYDTNATIVGLKVV